VHELDRADVEAAGGLGGDEQVGVVRDLAAITTFCWLPPERADAGVCGPPPRTSNSSSRPRARDTIRRGERMPRRETGARR
jgi:hypothetical protein